MMQSETKDALAPSPFVHVESDRLFNPMTGAAMLPGHPLYAAARTFFDGDGSAVSPEEILALESAGWAARPSSLAQLSRSFRLRVVSLETNTVCNQACYFCPVSIDPREEASMPVEMFERVVTELSEWRETIEGVFLQSYNEPTADRRFMDNCRFIASAGLPVAVLSNASGLTPARADALIDLGGLRYLCINLSTLDREKYLQDRGADHLPAVLRNLDYIADKPVARQMKIVVLGTGDDRHRRDFEEIRARFGGSRFVVEHHVVMDRAGYLEVGLRPADTMRPLRGCDNLGSRPIEHLHITPKGRCLLCCEDYSEEYVVGDLTKESVRRVLEGDDLARMRRWIYGLEEAPAEFMCRKCIFARR